MYVRVEFWQVCDAAGGGRGLAAQVASWAAAVIPLARSSDVPRRAEGAAGAHGGYPAGVPRLSGDLRRTFWTFLDFSGLSGHLRRNFWTLLDFLESRGGISGLSSTFWRAEADSLWEVPTKSKVKVESDTQDVQKSATSNWERTPQGRSLSHYKKIKTHITPAHALQPLFSAINHVYEAHGLVPRIALGTLVNEAVQGLKGMYGCRITK
eukprot:1195247-Prorocentrum_minimum.AAC.5